jgi:HEAT repeat protein
MRALARLGSLRPHEWLSVAGDPDPSARRAAAALAGTDPDATPGAEGRLVDLLDDPDDQVVEMAAWACGERPSLPDGAVAALGGVVTNHTDALCREAAVAALGAIGAPEALPTILAALHDKATVRRRALIALAPFDGPEVDAALRRHLEDRDRQVRQAAEDLLGR